MANATAPYQVNGKWTIDVDPDDINFIVWDVTKDFSDRATQAAASNPVSMVPGGNIIVLQGPTVQGTVVIALVKMDVSDPLKTDHHGTVRVNCANGEQFDRTIYFNLEDH
jgi:hypothetical protein